MSEAALPLDLDVWRPRTSTGGDLGLRGYVYGPSGRFGHHVLACFCFEEECRGSGGNVAVE